MQAACQKDLLEDLMRLSGCPYLSDLHARFWAAAVHQAVAQLEAEEYPPAQWNEAIFYITGHRAEFQDAPHAREYLLRLVARSFSP